MQYAIVSNTFACYKIICMLIESISCISVSGYFSLALGEVGLGD